MNRKAGVIIFALITGIFIGLLFFMPKESLSGTTGPGVRGTRHDLSFSGPGPWGGAFDTDEVCVFCHTPHGGLEAEKPLWNKSLPATTYTMYTSSSFNMGPIGNIGAQSVLCMSCHDGTMAMNSVINSPGRGTTGTITLLGSYTQLGEVYYPGSPWVVGNYLGPNISGSYGATNVDKLDDEHPISFTYNTAADLQGNNFPAVSGGRITGAVTGAYYRLYTNTNGSNQFECSTCHDVHDTASYASKDVSEVFFLRTSNAGSSMCKDCHRNK